MSTELLETCRGL